jgi:hypothetical protein
MMHFRIKLLLIIIFLLLFTFFHLQNDRGEVGKFGTKFVWLGTGEAFVPNYIMLDVLSSDLSMIKEKNLEDFILEFFHGHGFNGIHVPVFGQQEVYL